MTDYGHELVFGSFITPAAAQPQDVVALAQVSEEAGLDLVTFQDHPYLPKFLDTWTLLSYVAARTERVHVAANVTNLPLRPPAMLARAAASLDRLSGGRVALGLGAGAFWDGIEAMGGGRLTPGQSVEALTEAIRIIREIWDAEQRGGVRVEGEHYRVVGAKRGPAPAHPIPIWLGAYKPRMLRLVGSTADGCLPSLSYLPGRSALAEMNSVIDESATQAGRDPRAIRRLLNIGPEDATPESLAELALQYGISTFILGSDDASALQRFGEETAPATRQLVQAERAKTTRAT
ncbi:MAG TPA: LLM class flavin-dependent oxidoreductase [Micromonosporaceae bacterium]|nr:LLM class flavin-dependent oxidoreductase [Micromonosporaceae bacterium]